ncbi:hypothetical protein F4821DRAFT_142947 [Hypoxylon rubiginosum]|uniref:Uncharacterized protein n=1 Tax=Hypoxylon rubiginosum TaxID=110542 RepID=A0ACC0CZA2_9PEZI|nr:hypothetical protein F4821DRAFT_142947 [Hypoxylon rubiginosum]
MLLPSPELEGVLTVLLLFFLFPCSHEGVGKRHVSCWAAGQPKPPRTLHHRAGGVGECAACVQGGMRHYYIILYSLTRARVDRSARSIVAKYKACPQ